MSRILSHQKSFDKVYRCSTTYMYLYLPYQYDARYIRHLKACPVKRIKEYILVISISR